MIESIEHLLRSRIGLDVATVGRVTVERAVRQRMRALACADPAVYAEQLSRSVDEQQQLIEAVVVPETWFFRCSESFLALTALALAQHRARRGTAPLRLLSLPCSTGEEPYSIAMALLDAGLPGSAFEIDAIDVSHAALAQARSGLYGANALRGGSPGSGCMRHLEVQEDGQFLISPAVRARVRFAPGNLLDETLLPSRSGDYDFVFCRNLLIYFDRETQARAMLTLLRLLRPGSGVLFSGPAEASIVGRRGLHALGLPNSFAFKRHPLPPAPPPAASASAPAPRAPRPSIALPDEGRSLAALIGLADQGQSSAALRACEQHMARFGPSAELYYWLGLLHDAEGRRDAAQDYFRKALYLSPQHAEALAHLAALLAAQGDHAGARRLHARAARLPASSS